MVSDDTTRGQQGSAEAQELTLNDKAHSVIPQIGFGTFQIPPEDTQRAVEEALEIGYRHIDTAAAYYNEKEVGDALKATGMAGKVWVTTKLRNCDQGYDSTMVAFDRSRSNLGVDVVDMYLIHWPFAAAKAHDVTPAQVVLRWHTQEGRIIIPKSKHVERMRVNLASSDFDLTSAELAAIDALDDPHDNVSADPATFMHSQSWADQHVRGNI